MKRRFAKEVIYVDQSANEPLVYREKRIPPKVKLYEDGPDGAKVSIDGKSQTRDGFPIPWKNDRDRTIIEKKSDFLECLKEFNGLRWKAAEYLEIPLSTLRYWLAHDDGFRENVEDVDRLIQDRLEEVSITKALEDKDPEFVKLELKSKNPKYNPVKQTQVNVSGTVQHGHALIRDMSPTDKRQLYLDAAEAVDAEYEEIKEAD